VPTPAAGIKSEQAMDYCRRFFLFAAPAFDADDLEGMRFNQIVEEIERSGFEVVKARRIEDAESGRLPIAIAKERKSLFGQPWPRTELDPSRTLAGNRSSNS
jgi:hypothetical protein